MYQNDVVTICGCVQQRSPRGHVEYLLLTATMEATTSRSTYSCRLCRAVVSIKHAASLFSHSSTAQRLASRVSELLQVTIAPHDGLPQHICYVCKRRFESLEKAVKDLEEFRVQASETYGSLAHTRGPLKRTKESSAVVGVSPDIAKARPPAKKQLSRRQLDFDHGKENEHELRHIN